MYKNVLYLTFKLAALAAVFAYDFSADTVSGFSAAAALAFCCLFLTELLVCKLNGKRCIRIACILAGIVGCFACGAQRYYPLLLILVYELIELVSSGEYFFRLALFAALLTALVLSPASNALTAALILTITGAFARIAINRLEQYIDLNNRQREEINALNEKTAGLKAYAKTLRETVALEERSRFSTRIHDKLGHGISGSIILLEGARLNMESNPQEANKCLCTAIENLRGSVDSIRETLREERPRQHVASIASLKEMLERFSVTYEIKTEFDCQGDTEKVPPQIWNCISDNLTESMTNTIKHSDASRFTFKLTIYNKIIRAEYSNDGNPSGSFTKGMGLQSMEERTAACGGKCIFSASAVGFATINIFSL